MKINYRSRRLLGKTVNYIMADHVESIEVLSQYLFLLSLLGYQPLSQNQGREKQDTESDMDKLLDPDHLFMSKVEHMILSEPKIRPMTAPKLLWSLYAMNYKGKDDELIMKLYNSVCDGDVRALFQGDTATVLRVMAHFDVIHYKAQESLIKHAITNSDEWKLENLTDIAFSLSKM